MKKLDLKNSKDYNKIEEVATVIKEGGLVLFPTETVYGIRANGLDEKAVKKIFDAKGRASDNPLILHIANINMLMDYIIDGGKCEVGLESTVVKVENGEIKILRPGKISLVYSENSDKMINKINELSSNFSNISVMCATENKESYADKHVLTYGSKDNLDEIASNIFTLLRQVDKLDSDIVFIEGIKKKGIGVAIMNRLIRACSHEYIEV